MRVAEAMTRDVHIASPEQPIREAAEWMAQLECGALPVGENDRLVGIITDRDIAIRAVARGMNPDTPVGEVMSGRICYCFDDQDLAEVCENMGEEQVRRLPVLNRDKRLVGILSLADIAQIEGQDSCKIVALSGITEPGGRHTTQSARLSAS